MPDSGPPTEGTPPTTDRFSEHASSQPGARQPEQASLLAEMRALRGRTRTARHAYWFPLLLFGALTCTSIPFYVQPQARSGFSSGQVTAPILPFFGGLAPLVSSAVAYYWLAALLAGLLATLVWYRWHARRVGVQTPSLGFTVTTLILTAVAASIPPLSQVRNPHDLRFLDRLNVLYPGDLIIRGTFPFVLIAIGLLVLARAERSWALAAIAAIYTGSALLAMLYDISNVTARLGWTPSPADQALPNILLPALILVLAGAGALAARWLGTRQTVRLERTA
jgi:hypothetical protein